MEQIKNMPKPKNAFEFKRINIQRAREAYFKAKAEGKLKMVVIKTSTTE